MIRTHLFSIKVFFAVLLFHSYCLSMHQENEATGSGVFKVLEYPRYSYAILHDGTGYKTPKEVVTGLDHKRMRKNNLKIRKRLLKSAIAHDNVTMCGTVAHKIQKIEAISCLQYAVQKGAINIVEYFLKNKKFDVAQRDANNRTLLWDCVENASLVELLLRYGIDINAVDANNDTVVHHIVRERKASILDTIFNNSFPDLCIQNRARKTPLVLAKRLKEATGDRVFNDIASYLKEKMKKQCFPGGQESLSVQNNLGNTVIHQAIVSGNFNELKTMLVCGKLNLLVRNKNGLTPLGLIHELQKNGADVEVVSSLEKKTVKQSWEGAESICIICKMSRQELREIGVHEETVTPCCTHPLCRECIATYERFKPCVMCRKD